MPWANVDTFVDSHTCGFLLYGALSFIVDTFFVVSYKDCLRDLMETSISLSRNDVHNGRGEFEM